MLTLNFLRNSGASALAVAAVAFAAPALAACPAGGTALSLGTAASVPAGAARAYTIELATGQGVIIDLAALDAQQASSNGDDEDSDSDAPKVHALSLCDASGKVLAPTPGDVFEKGGSIQTTSDGERLRFVAPAAGRYTVGVAAGDAAREVLARGRNLGASGGGVTAVSLDSTAKGKVSSSDPRMYSFSGTAGQWVELRSTSEKDTKLNLAGPARDGSYSVIASNDDSDELNPMIRRRLPVTGTYYLQVDSLSDDVGDFTLSLKRIPTPPPPPPPAPLAVGSSVAGKLADGDDVKFYTVSVVAGHSYRLELTAPYDGVVAIGLPNPVEADDADAKSAGFSEVKSIDENTSGTEKLNFTARTSGQLLVQVRSFGTDDSDGGYTLKATDLGA